MRVVVMAERSPDVSSAREAGYPDMGKIVGWTALGVRQQFQ